MILWKNNKKGEVDTDVQLADGRWQLLINARSRKCSSINYLARIKKSALYAKLSESYTSSVSKTFLFTGKHYKKKRKLHNRMPWDF